MNYLIVSATLKEIANFVNNIQNADYQKDIDVLITGIGLTASTYKLTSQLGKKKYDMVVQAGIAGCYNKNLLLGSVVGIKKECIADQGVIEQNTLKTLFNLKLTPKNQFPYTKAWLVNPHVELLKKIKLKLVTGISVNEITTGKQKINMFQNLFNPTIESMEGAAFHYTCLMEKIPFIQLRSISNYVGERNKKNWDFEMSIKNLNTTLINLINIL